MLENTTPENTMPENNTPKNNTPRNPYARSKWLALGSMAGLGVLLNMVLHDWIASLHLAVVIVFTAITVGLAVHTLIVSIVKRSRRSGEDPGGPGGGPDGPDDPGRGPADPEGADPLRYQDDFGLAG